MTYITRIYRFFIIVIIFLSACSSTDDQKQTELTLSVAASMTNAAEEIVASFEEEHPNINVILNIGSSGALQRQIAQGAPVDLFLSASEDKFNQLLDKELVNEDYFTQLVSNKLVIIESVNSDKPISSMNDLTEFEKVAIGTPESVPAGRYAKEVLENNQLYQNIEQNLVFAKDVRQVLTYVETESVQAGFVYQTDALESNEVKIALSIDENEHSPIIYPLGILKDTKNLDQSVLLYNFLTSDTASEIFKTHGFSTLEVDE